MIGASDQSNRLAKASQRFPAHMLSMPGEDNVPLRVAKVVNCRDIQYQDVPYMGSYIVCSTA